MSDPTTPATPEEPTPAGDAAAAEAAPAAPAAPVAPQAPAAAEPATPAVAADPLHAAQTEVPAANPYVAPAAPAAPAANPYAAPAAPAAPAGAPGYATGTPVKQTLSLTSFIVGIASVIFVWIPVLGFLAAVAAVVLGFLAKKKEPAAPKWMWIVGLIAGFLAIFISLIIGLFWVIAFIAAVNNPYYYY
jgi:hypothetical protein